MSKHGVWKEYKFNIILGPCQCSAFALMLFSFWFQIKEKGRKAWHDHLNWPLKPTLVILHGARLKKKQRSALQANLGRRTNTEKEKNCEAILCKTDVVSVSWCFASCAWYLSSLRSFQGVISVLWVTLPIISRQINKLLKNCYRRFSMIQSLFFIKI